MAQPLTVNTTFVASITIPGMNYFHFLALVTRQRQIPKITNGSVLTLGSVSSFPLSILLCSGNSVNLRFLTMSIIRQLTDADELKIKVKNIQRSGRPVWIINLQPVSNALPKYKMTIHELARVETIKKLVFL